MTTPTVDMTAMLGRFQAGLRDLSDVELERRAATVAVLPGGDGLRRLVDAEREYRQAARRLVPQSRGAVSRSWVFGVAAGVAGAGAVGAVLAGRAFADYGDQVPPALLYSPVVAVGLVAGVVAGGRLVRWFDDRRHPLAQNVDEADLDPYGRQLLAQVRARRRARGEVC
ncbi:hypothetical protein [Salinispora sp. H7-4]|uniref:hypothetical protein n=1 Tax=Salinispora sp. H7-4 TaxID=2748321 RepID=UPI0015D2A18E|nr:hypothetical protein [Salinispora sp. H7-4]NYT96433.1 hypothetical protein [Salinispora sp. H7-4]